MTTVVLRVPLVASHDYDALRELVREAPATHHAWAELHRKRTAEARHAGHVIREMHVDPHRFADHARRNGYETSLATLGRFLEDIDPLGNDPIPPTTG